MKTRHCSQYRRYLFPTGEIGIRRDNRILVHFIPRHTPHVSIPITRKEAADGLRVLRQPATAA
jgi:hypothetical protein